MIGKIYTENVGIGTDVKVVSYLDGEVNFVRRTKFGDGWGHTVWRCDFENFISSFTEVIDYQQFFNQL